MPFRMEDGLAFTGSLPSFLKTSCNPVRMTFPMAFWKTRFTAPTLDTCEALCCRGAVQIKMGEKFAGHSDYLG